MALAINSYLNQQQPQQNQFLTGNPETQSEAQTSWMDNKPTTSQYSGDWSGGNTPGAIQPAQTNTPPSNGTALGAITAGNVGSWMPEGYDQNKWNDPNKHDPKYDIGRVLSKYPPTPAGLDAAMPELQKMGYRRTGKDSIAGADGYPIDVGRGFSDVMAGKTQQGAWWFNPSNPGEWNQQGQNNQNAVASYMSSGQKPQGGQQGWAEFIQSLLGGRSQNGMSNPNPVGGQIPNIDTPNPWGSERFRAQPEPINWNDPNRSEYAPNNPIWPAQERTGGHYEGIDWNRRWVPDNPADSKFNMPNQPVPGSREWLNQNNNGNTGISGGMDLSGGWAPNSYFGSGSNPSIMGRPQSLSELMAELQRQQPGDMVSNGWGKMVPWEDYKRFLDSGAMA